MEMISKPVNFEYSSAVEYVLNILSPTRYLIFLLNIIATNRFERLKKLVPKTSALDHSAKWRNYSVSLFIFCRHDTHHWLGDALQDFVEYWQDNPSYRMMNKRELSHYNRALTSGAKRHLVVVTSTKDLRWNCTIRVFLFEN